MSRQLTWEVTWLVVTVLEVRKTSSVGREHGSTAGFQALQGHRGTLVPAPELHKSKMRLHLGFTCGNMKSVAWFQ